MHRDFDLETEEAAALGCVVETTTALLRGETLSALPNKHVCGESRRVGCGRAWRSTQQVTTSTLRVSCAANSSIPRSNVYGSARTPKSPN